MSNTLQNTPETQDQSITRGLETLQTFYHSDVKNKRKKEKKKTRKKEKNTKGQKDERTKGQKDKRT